MTVRRSDSPGDPRDESLAEARVRAIHADLRVAAELPLERARTTPAAAYTDLDFFDWVDEARRLDDVGFRVLLPLSGRGL